MTIFQFYLILTIIIFVSLARLAQTLPHFPPDLMLIHGLQSLRSPGLDALMQAVSWPGYPPQLFLLVAAVVVVIYLLGFRWEAAVTGLSAGGAQLLSGLLKMMIQRPRPPAELAYTFETLSDFSFPSGHVMFYLGFFGFLGFLCYQLLAPSWKRTLLFVVFSLLVGLVGLSRLYLGVHWTSDVLAAYLGGSLMLALAIRLYRWGAPHFSTPPPGDTRP